MLKNTAYKQIMMEAVQNCEVRGVITKTEAGKLNNGVFNFDDLQQLTPKFFTTWKIFHLINLKCEQEMQKPDFNWKPEFNYNRKG